VDLELQDKDLLVAGEELLTLIMAQAAVAALVAQDQTVLLKVMEVMVE
jgi:hypothetical protein